MSCAACTHVHVYKGVKRFNIAMQQRHMCPCSTSLYCIALLSRAVRPIK